MKFVPKSVGTYLLRTPSDVDLQVKNVYDASLVKVMQPEPAVAGKKQRSTHLRLVVHKVGVAHLKSKTKV